MHRGAVTIKDTLASELRRRQRINSNYSLRAFARDLEMNPGFLSSVMAGKRQLSTENSISVSQKLGFGPEQVFELLQLSQGKSSMADGRTKFEPFATLQLDSFEAIADWYHFAILELTYCDKLRSSPIQIASRLGISVQEAKEAVARLLRLGLLVKENNVLKKTSAFIATPTDRPNRSLRSHQAQMLEKAKVALEQQSIHERDITGITFACPASKIPDVKKEIQKFQRAIAKLVEGEPPAEVYQLGVQFFRLSEPRPVQIQENPHD